MSAAAQLMPQMGVRAALRALGASHATWYRRQHRRAHAVARQSR
jgi:hypothetical protein